MKKIVFATQNKHKVEEISSILKPFVEIVGLAELGFSGEIPETSPTLEGNAQQKARFIYEQYGLDCFADDTGLEVAALDGAPGVYSARYAGEHCSFDDNVHKLLQVMYEKTDRRARFRTVICYIENGQEYFFEGEANGSILYERQGEGGFGYDPVFMPEGYDVSFAEMSLVEKNKISHRAKATQKLISFLSN